MSAMGRKRKLAKLVGSCTNRPLQPANRSSGKYLICERKMVGVARIELATPAMSTPATSANLLIFDGFRRGENLVWPT